MIITEDIIRKIIAESLSNILNERKVIKIPKAKKQSQSPMNNAPMGGDPMGSGDPNAMNAPMGGGDPNAMGEPMGGGDPNAMGEPMGEPMGGGDPNAMGGDPMGGDPMGGDPSMDSAPMGDDPSMGGEDDSTMAIINKLSPDDKDAVRAYAESMLNRDETQMGGEDGGDSMGGPQDMGEPQPMMETFIFTKKQIKMLNENFGEDANSLKRDNLRKPLERKKSKSVSKKSPFNSPRFK